MRHGLILAIALMILPALGAAEGPWPRPQARPVSVAVTAAGLGQSLRPQSRPAGIASQARKAAKLQAKGAVCGDKDLQGKVVGRVPGKISGCGVSDAIRLRAVSGISLTQEAVMDCTTAKALKSWVARGLNPAIGSQGGGVKSIRVAAHYACRTRNNKKGAKISEHGKGRAIDISGIILRDGREISVLRDWGKGRSGKALRSMHKAACGPFGTVLGPEADKYHRDHFHFDTARYRSGSYCR